MVLLDVLDRLRSELDIELSALHVHHGLSPAADAWQEFCARLCASRGVPLTVARVRVEQKGLGVEAAARLARYRAFLAQPVDYVVLAHHLDDQVETVLHNLLRGAGVRGLAGMPEVRTLGPGPEILRPFIEVPRAVITQYARGRRLAWVEDESNCDEARARSFLRRQILPRIEARFPAYRQSVLRASRHLLEADALLAELAALDLGESARTGRLKVAQLAALSPPRARNLLRFWLESQGAPLPEAVRLNETLRQLSTAGRDSQVEIPYGGVVLRRYRGEVWLEPARPLPPADWSMPWHGQASLDLPELALCLQSTETLGRGVSRKALEQHQVVLRLRRGGERLRLDCRGPRRSLKKLLQEGRLPPWLRARLPLVYLGPHLAAVPGIGVDCAWAAAPGEPGVVFDLVPLAGEDG